MLGLVLCGLLLVCRSLLQVYFGIVVDKNSLSVLRKTSSKLQPFIVIGHQRSGTQYFSQIGATIQGVLILHEVFHENGAKSCEVFARREFCGVTRDIWNNRRVKPKEFLIQVGMALGKTAVGAVVMPYHIPQGILSSMFSDPDVYIMVLMRTNALESFVSDKKAWHRNRNGSSDPVALIPVTFDEYLDWELRLQNWYSWVMDQIQEHHVTPLFLTYEALNMGRSMRFFYTYLIHDFLQLPFPLNIDKNMELTAKREKDCPTSVFSAKDIFVEHAHEHIKDENLNFLPLCLN